MRIRTVRTLAAASLLAGGLIAFPGCNAENPDGTKTNLGKAEGKAKEVEQRIEAEVKKDAKIVGDAIKKEEQIVGAEIKKDAKIVEDKVKDAVDKVKDAVKKD